jgi:CheY-like chemotaxis protein
MAIDYLAGNSPFNNRELYPLPAIMLLDLKMPVKTGFEVLRWVRAQDTFKRLIIVILSGSAQLADVDLAYELGANSFLVKPTQIKARQDLARLILHYWLNTNHSPSTIAELHTALA